MASVECEVIEGCDPHRLPSEVLLSTTPLLLKGLVADWQLTQISARQPVHALDLIRKHYSGRPVWSFIAAPEEHGRFFYKDDLSAYNFEKIQANLNDILDRLIECKDQAQPPSYYVGSTAIEQWLPGLSEANHLELDGLSPITSIWLGNRSTVSAHFDFPTNIACCVVGQRTFTLFPPEQLANLYLGPLDLTPAGQQISLVDFDKPDLIRYPLFEQALAAAIRIELEPGDAVFIPSMWWHHVRARDSINVLINYWWRDSPAFLGSPNDAFIHALLGIKDLPLEQRQAWKSLFNHFVFDQPEGHLDHLPSEAQGRLGVLSENQALQLKAELLMKLKQ